MRIVFFEALRPAGDGQFTARLLREERVGLSVGERVLVVGDDAGGREATVLAVGEAGLVELELAGA